MLLHFRHIGPGPMVKAGPRPGREEKRYVPKGCGSFPGLRDIRPRGRDISLASGPGGWLLEGLVPCVANMQHPCRGGGASWGRASDMPGDCNGETWPQRPDAHRICKTARREPADGAEGPPCRAPRAVDDSSINPEASLELRRRLLDPTRGGCRDGPVGRDTDPTLAELRRELLRLDVVLKELELSKRRGEVVERDKAAEAVRTITTAILDHIRRWPERAAAGIAETLRVGDVARVRAVLERRLAAHLEELGPLEPRL